MHKEVQSPERGASSDTGPFGRWRERRRVEAANWATPPEPGAGSLNGGSPADRERLRDALDRMRERPPPASPLPRAEVHGKFLFRGTEKLCLRGVTYGTFRPGPGGEDYPSPERVDRDFAQIAAAHGNAVRTYTVPPRWLLDVALRHGLTVMVGLPWEQHVTFLDDKERLRSIERRVVEGARACAGHPALLALVIGNEIPASIVRWYGRQRVERFLERLYDRVKEVDPAALVTYVNFPSTEYLQLPFLDFTSFNVYLEIQDRLDAYVARLQSLTGDRPLVMAEIGLDSRRNGKERQAEVLDWQIRTTFEGGCAGAFVFAWTDEWHRGGFDIEDWDFGLTTRDREPKAALRSITATFAEAPLPRSGPCPRMSVVVCSYNGAGTIRECLEALERVDYPDYEVIVVDDGSTDGTGEIALEYRCRVISTPNGGLSVARNVGAEAASGEIVAYLDDDAYPDSDWLRYLARTFRSTDYVAVGGPNIPPPGDGLVAECIGHAPGGPIHVLLSDREAEHLPGCNLAVRRERLQAIGGFDPQFRVAGDDVDFCWRLQEAGGRLGFNPAAAVFHRRRKSVRTYWRQQLGYGRAEASLERKWPQKYNEAGHVSWAGRLYDGHPPTSPTGRRWRVYHGIWGSAPFQSLYDRRSAQLAHLPLMPEWYLVLAMLAVLTALGSIWTPLLFFAPLLMVGGTLVVAEALSTVRSVRFSGPPRARGERWRLRALTFLFFLLQPAARLWGRARAGLTPWRRSDDIRVLTPSRRHWTVWSEDWRAPEEWLEEVESRARQRRLAVLRGGNFSKWDLEARGGVFGTARLRMVVEDHGGGKQLARFAATLRPSRVAMAISALLAVLAVTVVAYGGPWVVAALLASVSAMIAVRTVIELAVALGAFHGRGELEGLARARRARRRCDDGELVG